jgi:N-acetylglucosaminyldiphosphoundecaprenol N-acetyl-beta-D-mannosaminyltransferase
MSRLAGLALNGAMNAASAPSFAGALQPRDRLARLATPSSGPAAWPVALLGIPFDPVTRQGAIARIEAMAAARRPRYVLTANAESLVAACHDTELRRSLLEADLTLCDDAALVWLSRRLGDALPETIARAALLPDLMQAARDTGHRIFFLGATPDSAGDAARWFGTHFPGISLAGHYAPPHAALVEMDHEEIARRVGEAKPDILLVAFDGPQQEKWIARHHAALGVPVTIGIGALPESFPGKKRRKRDWLQRRCAALLSFGPLLAAQSWRLASPRAVVTAPEAGELPVPGWCSVNPGESLTRSALYDHAAFWCELSGRQAHWIVDLSRVECVDGTGLAWIVQWQKFLRAHDRELVLLAPGERFCRALAATRLDDYFFIARDTTEALAHATALTTPRTVQHAAATRALAWCGEIIAANADDVWRMTTDHVRAFVEGGASLVIIDLARLRFIDSAGADVMLRLTKWARELPAQVLFTHAADSVRRVLRLAQLDRLLLEGSQ